MAKYEKIFLVDDILTSGATLAEAAKVIKNTGVKNVFGLTLAHGE
jgi:predicted amidophosphoribosyltransferase